ncbi:hypothetical protein [Burkholderia gladioli]|uniref:hypothetical protein n=1 Tax=Burkholderia gladioli TaxID=28095 RepID=UPI00163F74DF|nr:hypothetical protein [Burkholderia gladioli]
MKRRPAPLPESTTDRELAARSERLARTRSAYPIDNPQLAEISELLHRICDAESLPVARWYAGDALALLRAFSMEVRK